jgi:hypothetical protein
VNPPSKRDWVNCILRLELAVVEVFVFVDSVVETSQIVTSDQLFEKQREPVESKSGRRESRSEEHEWLYTCKKESFAM